MGTKKHRHLRLAPPSPVLGAEWGATLDGELVTTIRRDDGERAVVIEAGDGVVRVRFLRLVAGRWATTTDATLEALATVSPLGLALDDADDFDPEPAGAFALLRAA